MFVRSCGVLALHSVCRTCSRVPLLGLRRTYLVYASYERPQGASYGCLRKRIIRSYLEDRFAFCLQWVSYRTHVQAFGKHKRAYDGRFLLRSQNYYLQAIFRTCIRACSVRRFSACLWNLRHTLCPSLPCPSFLSCST